MTASDFEGKERTRLDDQLDAALAKYAAVEPRDGLEARILANLRTQEPSGSHMAWWRWALTLAAALLIMTLLTWRAEHHRPQEEVHRANPEHQTLPQVAKERATENSSVRTVRKTTVQNRKHIATAALAVTVPRLDQFPSPRPLTEQEKLLAQYVSQFQEEAVVVARARAEVLRQDLEQMQHGTEPDDDHVEHTK